MSMATTARLPSPSNSGPWTLPQDIERAQNANSDMRYDAGLHAGRKPTMNELSSCSYPILLVPFFIFTISVKDVYMLFKSPVEVLFGYLPDYDSACKRTVMSLSSQCSLIFLCIHICEV
jgi:hypothetical protein